MLRKLLHTLGLAAVLAACWQVTGAGRTTLAAGPGVFQNYYVGPPGVPGQLYVSPLPAPPLVGYTWITYQALEPHEFLYHHHRTYHSYHPGAAWNTTKVHYHHSLFCN